MACYLDAIDWNRPWLLPFQSIASRIGHAADWRQCLNVMAAERCLQNHRGLPLSFVPQSDLPPRVPYEAFISTTGNVPTRDNLHDFFNALMWLSFHRIKVQLNALQAEEIGSISVENMSVSRRGKLRDAATIFDENGALIVAHDPAIIERLRDHRWQEIFVERRGEFGRSWEVWLFGHALMEKLVRPYKAITAHALPLIVNAEFFDMGMEDKQARLDSLTAGTLSQDFTVRDLTPLPVLGVPGWSTGQDDDFYADASVFRPRRAGREHR